MSSLNEMFEKMSEFLKSEAKTETIIGAQFKLGEFTCVPVISVGLGFGGGSAEEAKDVKNSTGGTGAGAGIGMGPVGFLITKGNEIQFIPTNTSKGLSAAFEKIPDLLEKYMDKKKENA